jgi:pyruvyltransferase
MSRRDGQLAQANVRGVDVAHWDPLRRTGRWGAPARVSRPVRNVGDLMGPVVVRALAREFDLPRASERRRLLTVGSILHLARDGDVVWGSGLNPKAGGEPVAADLDLRAVRGPRTAALLAGRHGSAVPGAYGDPALLLGALFPHLVRTDRDRTHAVTVVPNLNDLAGISPAARRGVLNPRRRARHVLRAIAASRFVVGSSLHGVVLAEAFGVPARAVRGASENTLKYEDYYLATGRDPDVELADNIADAIRRGPAPAPDWDPRPLLSAFPRDLWQGDAPGASPPDRVAVAIATLGRRFDAISRLHDP